MLSTELFGDDFAVTSNTLRVAEAASRPTRRQRPSQLLDGPSRHGVRQQTGAPGRPAPRVRPTVDHRIVASLELLEVRALSGRGTRGQVIHSHHGRVRGPCRRRVPHHGPVPSSARLTTAPLQYAK